MTVYVFRGRPRVHFVGVRVIRETTTAVIIEHRGVERRLDLRALNRGGKTTKGGVTFYAQKYVEEWQRAAENGDAPRVEAAS